MGECELVFLQLSLFFEEDDEIANGSALSQAPTGSLFRKKTHHLLVPDHWGKCFKVRKDVWLGDLDARTISDRIHNVLCGIYAT